jgi:hypothetical protein
MKNILLFGLTALLCALSEQGSADVKDELDICDAKYKLAIDLVDNDFKYNKIDSATYLFLTRRAMVDLAACQYRAATAGDDATPHNPPSSP